jgi:hypothetical protein
MTQQSQIEKFDSLIEFYKVRTDNVFSHWKNERLSGARLINLCQTQLPSLVFPGSSPRITHAISRVNDELCDFTATRRPSKGFLRILWLLPENIHLSTKLGNKPIVSI